MKKDNSEKKEEIKKPICEVCNKNESFSTISVPGVPISCAYCMECFQANAHPWWILVSNTACIGGIENAAKYWKEMVEATCNHLGKSMEEFNREVEVGIEHLNRALEEGD